MWQGCPHSVHELEYMLTQGTHLHPPPLLFSRPPSRHDFPWHPSLVRVSLSPSTFLFFFFFLSSLRFFVYLMSLLFKRSLFSLLPFSVPDSSSSSSSCSGPCPPVISLSLSPQLEPPPPSRLWRLARAQTKKPMKTGAAAAGTRKRE